MSKSKLGIVTLLVVTFVLYVFKIDLSLLYQLQQPIFFSTLNNFINSLTYPEGLSIYIGEFITEKLYFRYLGALFIVGLQGLFIIPFLYLLKKRTWLTVLVVNALWIASFLLFTTYTIKLESVIKLLIALWLCFSWVLISSKIKNKALNLLCIIFILIVNYWFGGGTSLLYGGLLIVLVVLSSDQPFITKLMYSLVCVILCVSLPFIAIHTHIVVVPLKAAYFGVFVSNSRYSIPLTYYVFIVVLLALFMVSLMVKRDITWKPKFSGPLSYLGTIVLIAVAVFLVDSQTKLKLSNDRIAEQGDWNKYLEEVTKVESPELIESFNTNRALFHLGLLLKDGKESAQHYGEKGLFIEHQMKREHLMLTSDLYWELGYINESRHWAHEAFTSFGMQPRILRRLVDVNIVLGKFNTANKYIALLKKSSIHRAWSKEKETYLNDLKKCEESKLYGSKIKGLPFNDFSSNRNSGFSGLVNLLENSNENKMVVEYLSMIYLLRHDLAHILELVPIYRKHDYDELPEMVQQAILVYMAKTGRTPDLKGYSISEEELVRFKVYSQLYSSYKRGAPESKSKITEKFSGTFWYYMHFVSTVSKRTK